ncbi:hypothetical protein D3D03_16385 [Exiguobacterium sp. RIT452]|nr:hypothetical protein D3D03_16385 [Exiguobacterium sp. RIT452]
MDQYVQVVSSIGFPAAMCFYFMFNTQKTLDALRTTVEQNTLATRELMLTLARAKGDDAA